MWKAQTRGSIENRCLSVAACQLAKQKMHTKRPAIAKLEVLAVGRAVSEISVKGLLCMKQELPGALFLASSCRLKCPTSGLYVFVLFCFFCFFSLALKPLVAN